MARFSTMFSSKATTLASFFLVISFCLAKSEQQELESNGTRFARDVKCSCGQRNNQGTKIVGGTSSKLNEFPWRVALFGANWFNRFSYKCGATLISNEWILTAAHCVQGSAPRQVLVSIGDYDLKSNTETKSEVRKLSSITVHPKWDSRSMENDIALLKLTTPIKFSTSISPICLPLAYSGRTFAKSKVMASGWGVTGESVRTPANILQKVELDVIENSQCSPMYKNLITNNKICTLTKGKDACQGDSGGSIDYYDPNTKSYHCVGVVSFGEGCARANKAGVYTRVTNYVSWIQEITRVSFCKP